MCGRYARRSDKQKIAEAFHVTTDLSSVVMPPADYNIAPSSQQPVIRQSRDTGEREMVVMRWGLIPFFVKSLDDIKDRKLFNAKSETISGSRQKTDNRAR